MLKRVTSLFMILLLAVAGAACNLPPLASQAGTATPPPADTPTFMPPPTSTPEPSTPAPATLPTVTLPTVTPPEPVDRVRVVLIALEDGGMSGPAVGCGDSAVTVEVPIEGTNEVARAALAELLQIREQFYGQSGLYNALYQSDLSIDSLDIYPDGTAVVHLSGQLMMGGVCDNPRVEAQLVGTLMQVPGVSAVTIFVNGRPLDEVLSLR